MAIECEMMFEGVCEEDFDRLVEQRNRDKFLVGSVSHCEDVLSELKCSRML